MELLRFCTIFAIFIKTETYSLSTDIEDQNSTALENNRREMNDMDVLRQIINQETVIRLALTKNVHVLLNDVQNMKRTMASTTVMVSSLQQTIATLTIRMDTLQLENQNLKDNNVKCHRKLEEFEQQFKTVDQNITAITENQISIVRQNDEKRENIANKTNKVVGDIKMEVRYLSVTLLDLKEKIEKDNRIKDEKSNEIESRWNTLIGHLKFEHSETRRTFSNLSALFRNLENSQSEMNRTLMENLNNTVGRLESQAKKTKDEQLKLSSAVASLEVFRMNVSKSNCDNGLNVAFTAGIQSRDNDWSGSTLVFPHVIFNEGGGYDANTGVFTALSTGTYVFYISIQSAFRKYVHLDIVLNGSAKVRALAWYNSGSKIEIHQTGTNLVVLPLNKADRVWVKRGAGSGYYSDGHHITTFSGFRLF